VKRIVDLPAVEIANRGIRFAQRRHTEINESALQCRAAKATVLTCGLRNGRREGHCGHVFFSTLSAKAKRVALHQLSLERFSSFRLRFGHATAISVLISRIKPSGDSSNCFANSLPNSATPTDQGTRWNSRILLIIRHLLLYPGKGPEQVLARELVVQAAC
jgi:hypothetical protein